MLNDLRTFTRLSLFFQVLPSGLVIALPLLMWIFDDSAVVMRATPLLLGLMLVGIVAWAVVSVTWTRRANRAVLAQAQDGTLELVGGRVRPRAVVPGRVAQVRLCSGRLTGVLGVHQPAVPARLQAVMTVLPPEERPRRVCVLVPADVLLPAMAKGSHHLVALHPTHTEVGALVSGPVDQAVLARDPRWFSGDLPTNNSVVGGYGWLVPIGLAGAAVGVLLAIGLTYLLA